MKFPTLYKRTQTGAIQQSIIEVEGNKYRTHSGIVGGKITISKWTECSPTNEGRSNERSAEEQAMFRAQSMFDRKQEHSHHLDINAIDQNRYYKPMLAQGYESNSSLDWSDVISQPKLDGIRCVVDRHGMWTRNGKPILSAPHIALQLFPLFQENPDLVLDGELYSDALSDDFNKIVSLAKKTKPTFDDLRESSRVLQYWIYDAMIPDASFIDRFYSVMDSVERYHDAHEMLSIVMTPTTRASSQQELDTLFAYYLTNGFEGQMIRSASSEYESKRSKNLLKRKEFVDEECTILDIVEGNGNWSGYAKSVRMMRANGIEFDAGIKGTQDYCLSLLTDKAKYIGSDATVRYQNLTPDGVPRFPVCYHIWDGKRDI